MSKISYSAVVLNERSRDRLLKRFKELIPEGWEVVGHHMTINMGPIKEEYERYLGLAVPLMVEDFAMNDKVAAVGVGGFPSDNSKPHITLAVNRQVGAKPMMSNELRDWEPIKRPLQIVGNVEEIPFDFE